MASKTTHGGKVKRIEVEMHGASGGSGYTIRHHHVQDEKGHYKEPTEHIATHHGAAMEHLHEHLMKSGSDISTDEHGAGDPDCCICDAAGEHNTSPEKIKKEMEED